MTEARPATMTVDEAIDGRQSVRAFLRDKPVPRAVIEHILRIAQRSPSGANMQPWHVWVVQGAMRDAIVADLLKAHDAGSPSTREYDYYPEKWREPYYARRVACGYGLYSALGIAKGDKPRMHAQHARNFKLFDAPVSLVVTLERDLPLGAWLDCGMFLQSIMVAARGQGLETCAQAAIAHHQQVLRDHLKLPDEQLVLCGIALGYAAPGAPENAFRTAREPLDVFVRWTE
jgi:nitroreductase